MLARWPLSHQYNPGTRNRTCSYAWSVSPSHQLGGGADESDGTVVGTIACRSAAHWDGRLVAQTRIAAHAPLGCEIVLVGIAVRRKVCVVGSRASRWVLPQLDRGVARSMVICGGRQTAAPSR